MVITANANEVPTVRAIGERFAQIKKRVPGINVSISTSGATPGKKTKASSTKPLTTPTTANGPAAVTPTSKASSTTTPFKVSSLKQSLAAAQKLSLQKSKIGSTGKKRKHSVLSDDEREASMTEDTSGSENNTPTKMPRRSPSLRRSASAKPKYRYEEDGANGSGEDDAAKEIDTGDEWAQSEDDVKGKNKEFGGGRS